MIGHATLRRLLVARGLIDPAAPWQPLSGGRTNGVWRVGTGRRALICKLFRKGAETPLFPNSPQDECAALRALAGTGMAPELAAELQTALGTCLIYRFVEGAPLGRDPAAAGSLLRRLHDHPVPAGLRQLPGDAAAILRQGQAMLAEIPPTRRGGLDLAAPAVTCHDAPALVFLHGDPVPANFVLSAAGPVLIDWQCPARGDACEDLAVFLSPAMQSLYGSGPLAPDAAAAFLQAYGAPRVLARLQRRAALFHWRMAVYCAWKAARGDAAYAPLVALEMAALEQAR